MRSAPCRAIEGSTTPVASMRRLTISIDCATACEPRLRSPAADSVTAIVPSGRALAANSSGTSRGIASIAARSACRSSAERGVKTMAFARASGARSR